MSKVHHSSSEVSLVQKFNLAYEYNVSWGEIKDLAKKQTKLARDTQN